MTTIGGHWYMDSRDYIGSDTRDELSIDPDLRCVDCDQYPCCCDEDPVLLQELAEDAAIAEWAGLTAISDDGEG